MTTWVPFFSREASTWTLTLFGPAMRTFCASPVTFSRWVGGPL